MRNYLDLLEHILTNGKTKSDRTGTGTISVVGPQLRFDLSDGFPLVTTCKKHIKSIIHELLWFLRGSTNNGELKEVGVSIWDEWALENGDLGPVYGAQWRRWPNPDGTHQDQIQWLLNQLNDRPFSRRHIVTAWNPSVLPDESLSPQENVRRGKQCLTACHKDFQVLIEPMSVQERIEYDRKMRPGYINRWDGLDEDIDEVLYQRGIPSKRINMIVSIRSNDYMLGNPYNVASYAILMMMLAHQFNYALGELVVNMGDCHVYLNHVEGAKEQLKREPRKLPTLLLNPDKEFRTILDYSFEDFRLVGYDPHPHIAFPIAV